MQTKQHHFGGAANYQFESNITALFPGPEHWKPSSRKGDPQGSTNRLELSIPNFPTSQGQYLFVSDIRHANSSTAADAKPIQPSPDTAASSDFQHFNDPSSLSSVGNGPLYITHPSFTALNAPDMKVLDSYTVSPLQTRFDSDPSTHASNNSCSPDGSVHSALTHSTFAQWPDAIEHLSPPQKRRRESTGNDGDSSPYTTGRRRKTENVEPGSGRAVYLEKNRKAASKCRSKQKKQQEDLVEAARDQEHRNKVLKSEVEMLKSDLRDLVELVGAHNDCPDTRLRRYVQLEADWLAAGCHQSPIAELLLSKGSSNGSVSPEKMSA